MKNREELREGGRKGRRNGARDKGSEGCVLRHSDRGLFLSHRFQQVYYSGLTSLLLASGRCGRHTITIASLLISSLLLANFQGLSCNLFFVLYQIPGPFWSREPVFMHPLSLSPFLHSNLSSI